MAVSLGADQVCLVVVGETGMSSEERAGGPCAQMANSKNGPRGHTSEGEHEAQHPGQ